LLFAAFSPFLLRFCCKVLLTSLKCFQHAPICFSWSALIILIIANLSQVCFVDLLLRLQICLSYQVIHSHELKFIKIDAQNFLKVWHFLKRTLRSFPYKDAYQLIAFLIYELVWQCPVSSNWNHLWTVNQMTLVLQCKLTLFQKVIQHSLPKVPCYSQALVHWISFTSYLISVKLSSVLLKQLFLSQW